VRQHTGKPRGRRKDKNTIYIKCGVGLNQLMILFCVVMSCRLVRRFRDVSEKHTVSTGLNALKMETVCFSVMVVSTYESTRCHNPELHRHFYR
jgi:hypothetical protein